MEEQIQFLNLEIGKRQDDIVALTAIRDNIVGGYKVSIDSLAPLQEERDTLLSDKQALLLEIDVLRKGSADVQPTVTAEVANP